eukprot:XP_011662494.1 PREDICTED: leucine-rich repeat extensin-like protein 1 [Strongylocentrotus purpuratus]
MEALEAWPKPACELGLVYVPYSWMHTCVPLPTSTNPPSTHEPIFPPSTLPLPTLHPPYLSSPPPYLYHPPYLSSIHPSTLSLLHPPYLYHPSIQPTPPPPRTYLSSIHPSSPPSLLPLLLPPYLSSIHPISPHFILLLTPLYL